MSAVIGVSIHPGPIALTVILCCASSTAITLLSIHTPALLAQYSAAPGNGYFAAADAIVMILPPRPCPIIVAAAARQVRNTPSRLTLITRRQSASGLSI